MAESAAGVPRMPYVRVTSVHILLPSTNALAFTAGPRDTDHSGLLAVPLLPAHSPVPGAVEAVGLVFHGHNNDDVHPGAADVSQVEGLGVDLGQERGTGGSRREPMGSGRMPAAQPGAWDASEQQPA